MSGQEPGPAGRSRRNFLVLGAGAVAATAVELPFIGATSFDKNKKIQSLQAQVDSAKQEVSEAPKLQGQLQQVTSQSQSLQTQLNTVTGFLYLSANDQSLLEAVAETIIPSDSNGPGAKEAGVIYFIDRQLSEDYGSNGTMYMQGPFLPTGVNGPITVDGTVYLGGTPTQGINAGTRYQYPMEMKTFWRRGLDALQTYSSSGYGATFEKLSPQEQEKVLTDLWNNKPTSFNGIAPIDFAFEVFYMVWSGFLTDPIYGGNIGMVGWEYVAFNGTNQGDFYGEGHAPLELATSIVPIRLKPASLAQFQQQQPLL